jgi:hypothetical protein
MPVAATGSSHDQGHRSALQSLLAADCHDQIVTTSDFADVSMQSCLTAVPQLAEWMKQRPAERLAAWRCVIDKYEGRRIWLDCSSKSVRHAYPPVEFC